jgi:hypothetical protein
MKIHLIRTFVNNSPKTKVEKFTFVFYPFERLDIVESFESIEPDWLAFFDTIQDAKEYLKNLNNEKS